MNSLKISARRAGSVFAAAALVLATALPGLASAATVTERSVELSSSAAGATGVTYKINFTAVAATAGAVVVDFCSDTPLIGEVCTAPTGLNISGATLSGGLTKDTDESTASKLVATGTINAGAVTMTLGGTGVTNPTNPGAMYARIITYANDTGSDAYDSATKNANNPGAHLDDGSVAMYITNKIGVSADVLESLVFCVSGETITANCVGSGAAAPALTPPTLKLGEEIGGVTALTTNKSEGSIYTQLSTNAVSGAIVSLKSNTLGCGGLSRAGAASFAAGCGILPSTTDVTNGGGALFGVKTATATADNGTLLPYDPDGVGGTSPFYSDSAFKMNWVNGDATGVTSTYGDPFLYTNNTTANNATMQLTFAAAAANNTPAGSYSADLSLIATGKF